MNPYVIEFFVKIIGIGAASGLFFQNNEIKIVSDNSNYFYSYNLSDSTLSKTLLYDNAGNNELVNKKEKLDLESMFLFEDNFYLLGSGSGNRPNRENLFIVNQNNEVHKQDLSNEYQLTRDILGLSEKDLNIEGSFVHKGNYYLLNRGNGPNKRNGIIIADRSLQIAPEFFPIDLSHVSPDLTFTDGTLLDNNLYFLAAIEHTSSTYNDGKIGGSYLGYIDLETLKVEMLIPLSDTSKYEGITLYKNDNKSLEFLLCEDPDNNSQESIIHRLILEK